ncbi:MAG: hypothetical protein D8H96_14895 [Lautropia sp.]|nr:MAG: hypothetical protein D8H96_14895 [Lautropia sp.]
MKNRLVHNDESRAPRGALLTQPRALVALCLSAAVLAACGGNGSEGGSTPAPGASAQGENGIALKAVARVEMTRSPSFKADGAQGASHNGQVATGYRLDRTMGTYRNGHVQHAIWRVNGVAKGWGPHYTTTQADLGKTVIYVEKVLGNDGSTREFATPGAVVVASVGVPVTVPQQQTQSKPGYPVVNKQPLTNVTTGKSVPGKQLVRTMGSYGNGHVLNAIWKVNGEAKGWGPHYTPTAADVGKTVVYTEEVLGKSGDRVNFTAAPVIIVASLNEAAPAPAAAKPTPAPAAQPAPTPAPSPALSAKPGYPLADKMPVTNVTGQSVPGKQLVRTMGAYTSGYVLNAIWKVDGVAKGWGPHYTPTTADVGKSVVYTEEVLGKSGDKVNFTAAPIAIVAAAQTAAPVATPAPAAKPAPTPAPAPVAAAPAAKGTVNSVQEIINDMKLYNEGELRGVDKGMGWATGPGFVVMGNNPRGTNTPSYWKPANTQFKSNATWNAVIPWLVVFDGTGNAASNTRVQLRNIKLYMKRKSTGRWEVIQNMAVSGEDYPKSLQGSNTVKANIRYEADGTRSLKPNGNDRVFHGWGSPIKFDAWDVKALLTTVQARLVLDNPNGTDDRSRAKYLIHVGADYYPEVTTRVGATAPAYYFPGVGVSRAKYVRNDWRAFNFSTIDAGRPEPGGSISTSELISNPPPLE